MAPMVAEHGCDFIALMWGPEGLACNERLTAIDKGQRQDIVDLIYGMMDGNEPDMASLSKEMQDCAKTYNVIMGKALYSDSWLEV